MRRSKKNPFQKEIERKYGNSGFDLQAFLSGSKKMKVTKEEIEDRYDISLDEFSYFARIAGYKVLADSKSLIIFK
ncbi:hypothetical protein [uncultured Brachyspira sp.]|uniref:hypothetical protein n=1 Tax=uncultured Brachyspira sp. TaxID=221953 RepID=UPI00260FFDE9|nr:hypothetical protein [uncultured Brachyspira sp.]